MGVLPVRRHRVAQEQPDGDRRAHRRLPERIHFAFRLINYALITAFLLYLIVMGVYLSWISRVRSFQGIPEVSYSWVTMSLPFGALLLLITTALKVRDDLHGKPPENQAVDVL